MRRLFPTSWPLWLQNLLILLVVTIISAISITTISYANLVNTNQQNVLAYISEAGEHQHTNIENALLEAVDGLNMFLDDRENRAVIEELLSMDLSVIRTSEGEKVESATRDLLRDGLLAPYPGLLQSAWLLTFEEGEVISPVGQPGIPAPFLSMTSRDQSTSPAYLAGRRIVQNPTEAFTQSITVDEERGQFTIDLVTFLETADQDGLGFLVLRLDTRQIVYQNLRFFDDTIPAISMFIWRPDRHAFALDEEQAAERLTLPGAQRALSGQTRSEIYTTDDGQQVISFYSFMELKDIEGGEFAFVAEVNNDYVTGLIGNTRTGQNIPWLVLIAIVLLAFAWLTQQFVTRPIQQLRIAISQLTQGNFDVPVFGRYRHDELGALIHSFVNVRRQIQSLTQDMTQHIDERVRDIQATQEINHIATSVIDLDTMMQAVVERIIEVFPQIYHAQIFLIDNEREFAILRASTGEPGQKLLSRGHRLAVGSISVIGQVTEQATTQIARDTSQSNIHRRNEFLPETRAELAIPLQFGDELIGALDVQSKQDDSFDDELIKVLTIMAGQITIAIRNAQLYRESQRQIEEDKLAAQRATRQIWQSFIETTRTQQLGSFAGNQTGYDFTLLKEQAFDTGHIAVGAMTDRQTIPVVIPVKIRGEIIGAVEWEVPENNYNYDRVLLAEELANRLAISLDNARLFEESRRAAERERIINDITAKLSSQSDIDAILELAVREVGQALQTPQVRISLDTTKETPTNGHSQPTETSE